MSEKRLTTISKYLSKHLRHAPHELGLTLQPGGWVPVDDLLDAARSHRFPIDYDELVEVVEPNEKQRFSFDAPRPGAIGISSAGVGATPSGTTPATSS